MVPPWAGHGIVFIRSHTKVNWQPTRAPYIHRLQHCEINQQVSQWHKPHTTSSPTTWNQLKTQQSLIQNLAVKEIPSKSPRNILFIQLVSIVISRLEVIDRYGISLSFPALGILRSVLPSPSQFHSIHSSHRTSSYPVSSSSDFIGHPTVGEKWRRNPISFLPQALCNSRNSLAEIKENKTAKGYQIRVGE